jgi:hypothetical protein
MGRAPTRETRLVSRISTFLPHWRAVILILIALISLLAILLLPPIAQHPAYHDFADARTLFGLPNAVNVLSNFPFLVLGVLGIALHLRGRTSGTSLAWMVFFVGVLLTCFGSAYYHFAPDNVTLVWDRLPMTLAFMGLFVALLSECLHQSLERHLLLPALVLGLASVGWWYYANDLRLYAWVQAIPLLTIPCALSLFPAAYTHRLYLLYGLGAYAAAKLAEFFDRELFTLTSNTLSGHSAKHLLASAGVLFVYLMLYRRKPARQRS